MKTTILTDNLRFPESPRWHEDKLWCCDLSAGRVVQIDLNGNVRTVVELADTPTSLGWTPERQLLVVAANTRRLLKLEEEELTEVADLSTLVEYPLNDMVVDGQGRAYIGDLGYNFGDDEATPQPAPLLLVTPEGHSRIVAEGLAFPNGLVVTPDGQTLIVAESHGARLTAFDIAADGSLSPGRVWAEFEQSQNTKTAQYGITPDGMCLDTEGAVWVASPNTREVLRVHQGSQITHRIPLTTIPLACMLGGAEGRTLFIPTIESLDAADSEAVGRIEIIQVDVPGAGWP